MGKWTSLKEKEKGSDKKRERERWRYEEKEVEVEWGKENKEDAEEKEMEEEEEAQEEETRVACLNIKSDAAIQKNSFVRRKPLETGISISCLAVHRQEDNAFYRGSPLLSEASCRK